MRLFSTSGMVDPRHDSLPPSKWLFSTHCYKGECILCMFNANMCSSTALNLDYAHNTSHWSDGLCKFPGNFLCFRSNCRRTTHALTYLVLRNNAHTQTSATSAGSDLLLLARLGLSGSLLISSGSSRLGISSSGFVLLGIFSFSHFLDVSRTTENWTF